MKKALLFAAVFGALSIPALAQQSPTGTSAGGPARVGTPGQVDGGVPGTRPAAMGSRRMARPRSMKRRMMRRPMMKRRMMRRKRMM